MDEKDSCDGLAESINPIDLEELKKDGVIFSVDESALSKENNEAPIVADTTELMNAETWRDVQGTYDDDVIDLNHMADSGNLEPFEVLQKGMVDITEGKRGVLKKIVNKGTGDIIPGTALAKVHYQIFVEYADEPYDSSRLRNEILTFRLNKGQVVEGLDLAVAGMRKGELSKFLVKPDYNLGKSGCPPRVPADQDVLMEVELLDFVDQVGMEEYYTLPYEERKIADISLVKRIVENIQIESKQYFKIKKYHKALRLTRKAIDILENHRLKNEEEEAYYNKEILRLYLNAAVCNLKLSNSRQVLTFAGNVLRQNEQIAKAHYLRGRAFYQMCEFEKSLKALKTAQGLEPTNKDISEHIAVVNNQIARGKELELLMYQNMFKNIKMSKTSTSSSSNQNKNKLLNEQCSEDFRKACREQIKSFSLDKDQLEMPVPNIALTVPEIACMLEEAEDAGLEVKEYGTGNAIEYRICKRKSQKTNN